MADLIDVNIEGVDEVVKRLQSLTSDQAKRAMRSSVRVGAKEIQKLAVSFVTRSDDPRTPENIGKNLIVKTGGARAERKHGGLVMRVGVLGGAQEGPGDEQHKGGDTFYWRFLEFGTSRMHARPFMRPAAEQGGQAAVNAIIRDLPKKIDRVLKTVV